MMSGRRCCQRCLQIAHRPNRTVGTCSSRPITQLQHTVRLASTFKGAAPSTEAIPASKKQPRAPPPPTSSSQPSTLNTPKTTPKTAPRTTTTTKPPPPPTSSQIPPSIASAATPNANAGSSIAQQIRDAAPSLTETYVAYGACEILVKEACRVADYTVPQRKGAAASHDTPIPKTKNNEDLGVDCTLPSGSWWYKENTQGDGGGVGGGAALLPTYNTWAQISLLHLYLLTVRIRCFPAADAPSWHQHLINHFFFVAEDRMRELHGIESRMLRNKYLKDLYQRWRGLTAAYDEGIMRGDAVLATAVWRNVFRADPDVDFVRLAQVVAFMRSVLASFDGMGDEAVATGDIVFGDPGAEEGVVGEKSLLLEKVRIEVQAEEREAAKAKMEMGKEVKTEVGVGKKAPSTAQGTGGTI